MFPLRIVVLLFLILNGFGQLVYGQHFGPLATSDSLKQLHWVDSAYGAMSLDQKLGQLFMVDVFSEKDTAYLQKAEDKITKYHIGGIIFSRGGPTKQLKLTNRYQSKSKIPLLIGMDAEWGLAMRLDSTFAFPYNMTLGAVKDNRLIKEYGTQLGDHLKRMGVHINFAPAVDINTNPKNPIIGSRSFGEIEENVSQKSLAFTQGIQQAGILGCAKHFPGHGDTDKDSHKTLPTVNFSKERLDSIELQPYKKLIKNGLASIMNAHLYVPALDVRTSYPSSLSKAVVTHLLKEKLQFQGLVVTDALSMKGATDFTQPGALEVRAFLAGNDILLIPSDLPVAINALKKAWQDKKFDENRLQHSVKKILAAKYKVGLHDFKPLDTINLHNDLKQRENLILQEKLVENAITVVKNKDTLLPLTHLDTKKIAYISFGDGPNEPFIKTLNKFARVKPVKEKLLSEALLKLKNYNTVIVGLHRSTANPWKKNSFTHKETVWLNEIARAHHVILAVFVKPYSLAQIPSFNNVESVVAVWQNEPVFQQKAAELIFGAIESKGILPVSVHPDFPVGTSIKTIKLNRLGYSYPERVGFNFDKLEKVDSLMHLALDSLMLPGGHILVARKGKVVFNKSYGHTTYEDKEPVTEDHIYDLASLTKILATLPLLMRKVDEGKLSLNSKLATMLPELKGSNKENISLKEALSHYGRFRAWIPFYLRTLDTINKKPDTLYYRSNRDENFPIPVNRNLYIKKSYKDTIYRRITESELLKNHDYRYSDMPYYYFKEYIEKAYDEKMEKLVQTELYENLGAINTTYNPLEKISLSRLVPSEVDTYYRYDEIKGYVHDMGAAMLGGVGGHAGLFSNANDVAKIMQMFLQKGSYGGNQFIKQKTIDLFNHCYYCSHNVRRGVGFDKPQLEEPGPTCGCVSPLSFGHSGFTGTFAWADPEYDLVYVFLSNRTYPTMENRKLIKNNIRSEIQRLIYNAITD